MGRTKEPFVPNPRFRLKPDKIIIDSDCQLANSKMAECKTCRIQPYCLDPDCFSEQTFEQDVRPNVDPV